MFGGGTDVEPYASLNGGLVINLAINIRQRITLTNLPIFSYPDNANPDFYSSILYDLNCPTPGLIAEFDGLIESGIGSSASAAVALVGAVNKKLNLGMDRYQIAEKAWDIEVNKLGLYGGKQDQYAATFGGVNVITFTDKEVDVHRMEHGLIEQNLVPSMVLLHTGLIRKSIKIQEGLKELSNDQKKALDEIKSIAEDAQTPVYYGLYQEVGKLLDWSWELKKKSNNVTTPKIDAIYTKAKKLGAIGGKLCGSGGGGYMLFIVPPDKRKYFTQNIGLDEWEFSIDWNGLEVKEIK